MRMNIQVWWDESADGPSNMAADELLAGEALLRDTCCVRIYGWERSTVSLGGFQPSGEARAEPRIRGLPLVRRPSGGGAIVHGSDLTYAAAVPKTHPWGGRPQALYDAFHEALCRALGERGIAAAAWRPEMAAPDPAGPGETSFFCFDRRSPGDVVIPATVAGSPGHKVLGSAQRRLAATILQHGSLLLRRNPDLSAAGHPGLDDLATGGFAAAAVRPLAERWLELVAAALAGGVESQSGHFATAAAVRERARSFADVRWLERR